MTFLSRKIRAVYAGAVGALGFAAGTAAGPLTSQSSDEQAVPAPIELTAIRA